MKLVVKFGGSSVADAARIRHVASIVRTLQTQHQVVPVVSAMDAVTELLLDLADAAGQGDRSQTEELFKQVELRHLAEATTLGAGTAVSGLLTQLRQLVFGVLAVEELTPRTRDAIVAYGERVSCCMLAHELGATALDGRQVGIVTNDHFGEADPLMDLSMHQIRRTLEPMLKSGQHVVVTGFIAANQHGVTSTLGRGGSDYTATILGAALKADEIWIYSDVDGLMTADPRIIQSARWLPSLSFSEAVEMGKFGAKSMHPRALEPAAMYQIPVRMRSTFKPDHPGTLISELPAATRPHAVQAVPMLKGLTLINIGSSAMVGRPGSAAELFDALAQARVNIHMICQSVSEAGISLVVSASQADKASHALERVLAKQAGLQRRALDVHTQVCVVAPLGAGMKGTPGIAAKIFAAIASANVNVLAIAQGSSEQSISVVVDQSQGPDAVRAVHEAFALDQP